MPAGHEPVPPAPPASRRSASTGALSANQYVPPRGQPFRTQHAALPGPPPGPPPSSSRSASMSRASDEDLLPISIASDMGNNAVPIIAPPIRRPHHRGTQLGPVPPTPADWTEFPLSPLPPQMRKPSPHPLSVETGSGNEPHPEPVQLTPATSLPSAPPRESSVKPIRERRSESRAARGKSGDFSTTESGHNPFVLSPESADAKPANLVLTSPNSGMSRQPAVKKARASPIVSRFEGRGKDAVRPDQASTPPFSPATEPKNAFTRSPALPTKALPTPPPQSSSSQLFLSPSGSLGIRSPDERPISHILHTPHLEDLDSKSPPLIPQNVSQLDAALGSSSSDQFTQQAMDRHRAFLRRESQAVSDSERLALFANYMVTESRIRRDRYSAAFALMEASDIMDLTRNLWRSQQPSPSTNTDHGSSFPTPVRPGPSRADSIDSFASMSSPPSSAHTNFTPRTEPESPGSACSSNGGAPDKNMWTRHQPVLSPIPSMAMSTVPDPDEEESRGRAPSRWWESSAGSAGAGQRIERSKRESKYMGLRPEALATLQWQEEPSPSLHSNSTPRTVSQQTGEYPPEKVGWHEELDAGPAATPTYLRPSVPSTPDPHKLDVSRLVTLPPPYPRHYPAMHNNHPDLETLRSNLEHLRDLDDVSRPKEIFCTKVSQRRELQAQELNDRHAQMRHNIQEQLQLGQMSYADAAVAEENFSAEEARNAHRNVQEEFNHFQPEVMTPLHALLSERITKATAGLTQIRAGLSTSADNPSPNHTQEEGDEKPELLEKLNLLKWLFEARESLHKELFVLEGEKNERYREVIMMPFRSPGNEDKLQHAEAFFDSDRQERKLAFEKATLKRFEEFAKIVEENVMRGVEDQLNAFWDIAPPLLAVVQRVPHDLRDFEIQIPEMEYEDNPQYHDYPLQYLFSLLTHTEKSAYQFIESQINLMCLLHEAHTGVMAAGIRLLETQRCGDGEDWKDVTSEMGECRKAEEGRLTMELKDKVETVESQWREALGSGLGEVKQRVENFLVGTGGWDDGLLE
ncbi:hypothetical protein EJ08DRAFT_469385 [Tothia fuscella]|uniref:Uncharacterized protein n=1 Tax=Tothia fuscella TaxID=1048955 RepID=A0A9P4NY09_9PEZI|nr:hypothetical protein EJ08DRAFT_469385 [Tothia fuscella]